MAVDYADLGIELPRHIGNRRDVKCYCPRCHGDRSDKHDKSLSVNVDEACWQCHYCGWADYLENHNKADRDWRTPAPRVPHPPPPPPTAPADRGEVHGRAAEFLATRGLPDDTAVRYSLWGDDRGIHIPYYVGGQLTNIKHRWFRGDNLKSGHSMETGQELSFWNIDAAHGVDTLVITEGEWDAMAVEAAGMVALSVPNGANKGELKLGYFDAAADILAAIPTILIATDGDDVGGKLEQELVRRIGVEKCKRVYWSTGKDANDVLIAGGVEALRADLANATEYPVAGIVRPSALRDQMLALYRDGLARGVSTGIPNLDPLFTILDGYVTLVTGMAGSGKSELLDQIVVNTGIDLGWRWAIFSPEGDPREEHMSRFAEKLSGLPFFAGPHQRMSEELADRTVDWMEEHLTFIDPDDPTIESILEAARVEVLRRGIKCLIIDPWNELTHLHKPYERSDQYLSRMLRDIRRWAERNRVHVFIVNHPHQMQIDQKTGEYPVVRQYDLNEGAMWSNKVGGIISIRRLRTVNGAPVEVHVLKTKTRRIGRTGMAHLTYDPVTGRYAGNPNDYEFVG
jgi:twinkle protein